MAIELAPRSLRMARWKAERKVGTKAIAPRYDDDQQLAIDMIARAADALRPIELGRAPVEKLNARVFGENLFVGAVDQGFSYEEVRGIEVDSGRSERADRIVRGRRALSDFLEIDFEHPLIDQSRPRSKQPAGVRVHGTKWEGVYFVDEIRSSTSGEDLGRSVVGEWRLVGENYFLREAKGIRQRILGDMVGNELSKRLKVVLGNFADHAKPWEKVKAAASIETPDGAELIAFAQHPETLDFKSRFPKELVFIITKFGKDAELANLVKETLGDGKLGPVGIVAQVNGKAPDQGYTALFDPTPFLPEGENTLLPVPVKLASQEPVEASPRLALALIRRVPAPTQEEIAELQQLGREHGVLK